MGLVLLAVAEVIGMVLELENLQMLIEAWLKCPGRVWCSSPGKKWGSLGASGAELDSREVPKCQLAKTHGKAGGQNVFPRRSDCIQKQKASHNSNWYQIRTPKANKCNSELFVHSFHWAGFHALPGGICFDIWSTWTLKHSQMASALRLSTNDIITAWSTMCLWIVFPVPGAPQCHASHCQGQRQVLTDVGVGQAAYLLTGLPPFLRCKDLRCKNRGEMWLDCKSFVWLMWSVHMCLGYCLVLPLVIVTVNYYFAVPTHPQERQNEGSHASTGSEKWWA